MGYIVKEKLIPFYRRISYVTGETAGEPSPPRPDLMRISIAVLLFVLAPLPRTCGALLPDTLSFGSALMIKGPPGFPDEIARRDPLEAAIVNGTWAPPRAGESIGYDDTSRGTWETVTADSAGWYEHPSLRGGYVYVAVDVPGDTTMLLEARGNSMAYVNGVPRSGNPYAYKDDYESWEPRFDYSLLPVRLTKGRNDFLFPCTRGRFKATLIMPRREVLLNTRDLTLPDLIAGADFNDDAAVVVMNALGTTLVGWTLRCSPGASSSIPVPPLMPFSVRKVRFRFSGRAPAEAGAVPFRLALCSPQAQEMDSATIVLRAVTPAEPRKETFVSSIDGSVQYYAVTPASSKTTPTALFLSLHGASVEEINQARAYAPKSWGVIVAPTNRRPYGFNWEDWGRWDALEVLALAKKKFSVDESRVYLTGHSMGGHGTYHLGSLFPDQFAAIGPSAGWISFWTYRVRGNSGNPSPMREMLMRATLPSATLTMAANVGRLGVYILHGSQDDNVSVEQSRMMARHLGTFHRDFVYREEQGAGHWWDNSDTPGADCVDWPPMFDFFARHARPTPERILTVEFITPSPGVSSSCDWVSVEAQAVQGRLSGVNLRWEPGVNRITGTTENIVRFSIDTKPLRPTGPIVLDIDRQILSGITPGDADGRVWFSRRDRRWEAGIDPRGRLKNPGRTGTFKDLFRNRVLFVYGTSGTPEENRWASAKARFDAERFWYEGNGSIDVLPDREFNPELTKDRNVVLYGNANTNRAWNALLGKSPVQVTSQGATLGSAYFTGGDLACLVIRPRPGSTTACVGAVAGTGITGMRLTDRMPYLLPGVAYPDLIIGRVSMLTRGESGIEAAGFFGEDWSVEGGEFVRK